MIQVSMPPHTDAELVVNAIIQALQALGHEVEVDNYARFGPDTIKVATTGYRRGTTVHPAKHLMHLAEHLDQQQRSDALNRTAQHLGRTHPLLKLAQHLGWAADQSEHQGQGSVEASVDMDQVKEERELDEVAELVAALVMIRLARAGLRVEDLLNKAVAPVVRL